MAITITSQETREKTNATFQDVYCTIKAHVSSSKNIDGMYVFKSVAWFYNSETDYTDGKDEMFKDLYVYTTDVCPNEELTAWFYNQLSNEFTTTINV